MIGDVTNRYDVPTLDDMILNLTKISVTREGKWQLAALF